MIKKLNQNDEAVIPIILIFVLFVITIILIPIIISLTYGLLTFVGLCLLVASAFVLFKEKGKVTFTRNSVFMWLVIFGVLLVAIGPFTSQMLPTIDFSVIPGAEKISLNLLG